MDVVSTWQSAQHSASLEQSSQGLIVAVEAQLRLLRNTEASAYWNGISKQVFCLRTSKSASSSRLHTRYDTTIQTLLTPRARDPRDSRSDLANRASSVSSSREPGHTGSRNTRDVLQLIENAKKRVVDVFGVDLDREVLICEFWLSFIAFSETSSVQCLN